MNSKIDLALPDIERWRSGNTGVEFVTTIDSGRAGPHVMVNSIAHGNEICGAIAVDRLLDMGLTPKQGKLTLSFANVDAFHRFDPAHPHSNRFVEEDFNRLWAPEVLNGPRDSLELRRARAMRPIVDQVDMLLDFHSMHDAHKPILLSGPLEKGIALGKQVGIPRYIVSDQVGHPNGRMLRDYGGFGDPNSSKNSLIIECGWHWERSAAELAWQAMWRFLRVVDILDRALVESKIDRAAVPTQEVIVVTESVIPRTVDFRLKDGIAGLDVLQKGDLIAVDGDQEILAPFDDCVLIMPTLNHVKPGLPAVRLGRRQLPSTPTILRSL